jgi:spore germination cell wall hydrolase CwlJ-like protein
MVSLLCLATVIFFEARGEPFDGKLGVGQVIVNRTESEKFPDTVCEVVHQPDQFSVVENGKLPNPIEYIENTEDLASFVESVDAAVQVLEGDVDLLPTSTHFHSVSVSPGWSQKLERDGRIGNHIFYTEAS